MLNPNANIFIPKTTNKNDFDELEKEIYLNLLQFSYYNEIQKIIQQKENDINNGYNEYFVNLKYIEILKNKHYEYINIFLNL